MASDWDQRQLCPDGGCVGVIGPDGTCKTCGRVAPNWGDERRRGKRTTAEVEPVPAAADAEGDDHELEDELEDNDAYEGDDGDEDGDEADDGEYEDDDDDEPGDDEVAPDLRSPDEVIAAGDGPADFDNRLLCPDGACIGVIGDNGRCRVCGKKGV
jgi:hypothetical protein